MQYATLEDTVYFWFAANNTDGSGNDGANPVADVRLAGAAAAAVPVLSPTPVLLTHANYPDGCHEVAVDATAVNGFAANNTYAVFCALAVDGQNPTGFVGAFKLRPCLVDVRRINDGATDGNNATLYLKQVSIVNNAGSAIIAQSSGANGTGIEASGNGSGDGLSCTGGATGQGLHAVGGSTSGNGLRAIGGGGGSGISAAGSGGAYPGIYAAGYDTAAGIYALGGEEGHGLHCYGGTTSGHGIYTASQTVGDGLNCAGGATSGNGFYSHAATLGHGFYLQASGANQHGIYTKGSATSGDGIRALAQAGNGSGMRLLGNGDGAGLNASAGLTGIGFYALGGVTSGAGAVIEGQGGNSYGLHIIGYGSGSGLYTVGGATGHGVYALGGATSGDGIYAAGQTLGDGMTLVGAGALQYDLNADIHGTIDLCTANTDMRGTNLAALAATALTNVTWTDARAGFLDNIDGHTAQSGDTFALASGASGFVVIDNNVDVLVGQVSFQKLYVSSDGNPANGGTSWSDAYDSVQDAIDAADAGDTIYLSSDTFAEAVDFGGKALTLKGRGPTTIITQGAAVDTLTLASNSSLRNLMVNHTGASPTVNDVDAIYGTGISHVLLEDVWVDGTRNGISIAGNSSDVRFVRVQCRGSEYGGSLFLADGTSPGWIIDSSFETAGWSDCTTAALLLDDGQWALDNVHLRAVGGGTGDYAIGLQNRAHGGTARGLTIYAHGTNDDLGGGAGAIGFYAQSLHEWFMLASGGIETDITGSGTAEDIADASTGITGGHLAVSASFGYDPTKTSGDFYNLDQQATSRELIAINLDHLCYTATAGADMTTEVADNTILSRILANGDTSAFNPTTDGLQPMRDQGDVAWITATPASILGYNISTIEAAVKAAGAYDSLVGLILQARHSNTVDNAGFLTVYQTDDATEFQQLPITVDATADPMTGISD